MYQPKPPPFNHDTQTLAQHVNDEFHAIAQSQSDTVDFVHLNVLHQAPFKPRDGMLVDVGSTLGATADFGYGAGLYRRNADNTDWVLVASADADETYTPTITAGAGAITDASGTLTYKRVGRFVLATLAVSITTNGTGASFVRASLPFTAISGVLSGLEIGLTGDQIYGVGGAAVSIFKYDSSYPGADGAFLSLSGVLLVA
jgi:hypothetical protein